MKKCFKRLIFIIVRFFLSILYNIFLKKQLCTKKEIEIIMVEIILRAENILHQPQ